MSSPSSNGRSSASRDIASVSSHTLTSRYSGTYGGAGEGSSSQQSSPARNSGDNGNSTHDNRSDYRGSLSRGGSLEGPGSTNRRHRNRGSGGFLLDSTFLPGSRSRQPSYEPPEQRDSKGKRSVRHRHSEDSTGHGGRTREAHGGPSLRSPLSREVIIENQNNTREEGASTADGFLSPHGELHVRKLRNNPKEDGRSERDHVPSAATIDPNQIVHMALNLSESRRRNLSAGQLVIPSPSHSKRITSPGIPPGGSYGAGSSLRQYLNDQRRASRNISPIAGRSSPSASRIVSTSSVGSSSMTLPYQDPSPATLARRDKARAYIELKYEYIRLLQFLPPLKPDSSAPGNFIFSANNIPGSTQAHLTRVPSYTNAKYQLGRAYDPLQFIRNRRLRARERKSLEHGPEEFEDVERVRDWIDRVEIQSHQPDYRRQDGVTLPQFHPDHETTHTPVLPPRPRMGWVFTPQELLADTYWLEQGDNKSIIEDQYGRKVFPPSSQSPQDFLQPRASREYSPKRRKSWVESTPRVSLDGRTGDESETVSDRGRKRRLLPGLRLESPMRPKKQGWRKSGDWTGSSDSESGSRGIKSMRSRRVADVNIGPLERKMKEIMEKEANEAEKRSPGPISPDKWGGGYPTITESNTERQTVEDRIDGRIEGDGQNRGTSGMETKSSHHNKRTSLVVSPSEVNDPRSSFEDLDSSVPNSPLRRKFLPHIGADLSPPVSRPDSGNWKSKRSKLDIFRSEDSSKGAKSEPDSAGRDKIHKSRKVNTEEASEGNGEAVLPTPATTKSSSAHKKNHSVATSNSPYQIFRKDTKDMKDPSSAVTRFFKGVRHEGSKVGEFIFRKDRPPEDPATDSESSTTEDSDGDEGFSDKLRRKYRPKPIRNITATTVSSTGSREMHHHLDLPTFRSSNQNQDYPSDADYATDSQALADPIPMQARARANSRSKRFDKLAPPPMDMRSISGASSAASSRSPSPYGGSSRIKEVLRRPGGVEGYISPLARSKFSESSGRPTLKDKRHWSITDGTGSSLHLRAEMVTKSDIARVRALLLCSGVKAKEITRRAQSQSRGGPSPFLLRAAKAANAPLIPVPKKEEHVLAARMLVQDIETTTQAVHITAEEFRDKRVTELMGRIAELKSYVETELFPRVRKDGDEAVQISRDVAGSGPLAVKEISDGVDKMIRMRRRRTRWIKRVGWMLVEWSLLGVMWWVWFVVVVLRLIKGVFGGLFSVVKWFLWL